MNGLPPNPVVWQEARHVDGRVYYFNTQTKATQWTKPEALMSEAEVIFNDSVCVFYKPG
jgi:pre-mRNA-processing factor 40